MHLSEDDKAGLVSGEPKHDEVSVQPIQAVPGVGVPAGPASLLPDVGHDFVLPLPRCIRIRQYHLHDQEGS